LREIVLVSQYDFFSFVVSSETISFGAEIGNQTLLDKNVKKKSLILVDPLTSLLLLFLLQRCNWIPRMWRRMKRSMDRDVLTENKRQ
jgi:hypothetical protein